MGREVDRVPWRWVIVGLLVASLAIPLATLLEDSWTTHPSDEDIAEAKEIVAEERPPEAAAIEQCHTHPGYDGGRPMDVAECKKMFTSHYEDYLEPPTTDLDAVRRDVTAAGIAVLLGLMVLIGTTFVGRDLSVGDRDTQRRRLRRWLSRALAVTAASTVAVVVGLSLGPSCPEVYIPEDYEAANCRRQIITWDGEPYLGVVLGVAVVLLMWVSRRQDVT